MIELKVGQVAPFPVPDRAGCLMEIGFPAKGLNVLAQYPHMTRKELQIFNEPMVAYSFYESETVIPIAYWVFRFSQDLFLEATFDAGLTLNNPDYHHALKNYQEASDEGVNNHIVFIILDHKVIKALRVMGLHPEAVQLFHQTIKKQLDQDYSHHDFVLTMKQLEGALTPEEMFSLGTKFLF